MCMLLVVLVSWLVSAYATPQLTGVVVFHASSPFVLSLLDKNAHVQT